jgi:hypothetical protein
MKKSYRHLIKESLKGSRIHGWCRWMDPTTRWISILGIAALCFGLALFVLRVPVRTILIFFAIGVPLIILWLYADEKSKQQKRINKIIKQRCICSICKHEQAKVCLDQKCACCIMMKGSDIMGHSINPLQ